MTLDQHIAELRAELTGCILSRSERSADPRRARSGARRADPSHQRDGDCGMQGGFGLRRPRSS